MASRRVPVGRLRVACRCGRDRAGGARSGVACWRACDGPTRCTLAAGAPPGALWIVAGAAAVLASRTLLDVAGGRRLPLPYLALHDWVPGFSSLRVPIRFVIVVAACLAALAGFAFARATSTWQPRDAPLAAVVLVAIAAFGAAPHPPGRGGRARRRDRAGLPLARRAGGPGAVLEIPAQTTQQDVGGNLRSGRYMVAAPRGGRC